MQITHLKTHGNGFLRWRFNTLRDTIIFFRRQRKLIDQRWCKCQCALRAGLQAHLKVAQRQSGDSDIPVHIKPPHLKTVQRQCLLCTGEQVEMAEGQGIHRPRCTCQLLQLDLPVVCLATRIDSPLGSSLGRELAHAFQQCRRKCQTIGLVECQPDSKGIKRYGIQFHIFRKVETGQHQLIQLHGRRVPRQQSQRLKIDRLQLPASHIGTAQTGDGQ